MLSAWAAKRSSSRLAVSTSWSVLVLCLSITAVSYPVAADDSEAEVPVGTMVVSRDSVAAPLNTAPAPAKECLSGDCAAQLAVPDQSATSGADDLFRDARDELAAGRDGNAQRLFEMVVARAPDSALANSARRHLGELYARRTDVEPRESAAPEVPTQQATARRQNALSDVAADPALTSDFQIEAGDRIFFSAGSAELGSRARAVLAAQARYIKLRSDLVVTVEGHADDPPFGGPELEKLSLARAEAVRDRLVAEGIDAERLDVVGYGSSRRVAECPDPACGAQNRRVITVLSVREGAGPPMRKGHSQRVPLVTN